MNLLKIKTNLVGATAIISCLLLFSGCEDFIETNLKNKSVTVLSPANNSISSQFSQTFWWEEVKGAESYQLQIVKPSFSGIQYFITDTTVFSTRLQYTLQPGTYQWRIRAKNNSSETEYVTYTLTIDSTLDLTGQPVPLTLPLNNLYTGSFTQTFTWQTMPNSNSYLLQILSGSSVIETQSTTATTGTYTFAAEGSYTWRVLAQNSTSTSAYNTRTITVDTAKPATPTPSFPLTDTITADNIALSWNTVETNASYRVQVSTDSTFASIPKDTVTATTSYNLYNAVPGYYYYWRVKAIDQAANAGLFCTRRRIKRN